EAGRELFERFCGELESQGMKVKCGAFGEPMLVIIENDGPVTLILDSQKKGAKYS
ncbi:D-aminoacyl-tRNA deacylase, partial [bacterium]|nr:D-aminoacyl-tRNA deacylase [bacterium]